MGASVAGAAAEVDCAASPAAAASARIAKTLARALFDRNFSTLPIMLGEMLDARVQHTPHPFEHFDTGAAEMLAGVFRPDMIEEGLDLGRCDVAKETAVGMPRRAMLRRALLFVHITFLSDQPSFISTVNILFCNEARVGVRAAMEVGNPMWRRNVPISTTSSSPFLNSPTSPFIANGSRRRTS
jgi:hypothetical protein